MTKSISQFVENQLIWVVSIIRKYIYTGLFKVFFHCSRTSSATTLTVFALADDVHSALNGSIYKICQFINFGEIGFVC